MCQKNACAPGQVASRLSMVTGGDSTDSDASSREEEDSEEGSVDEEDDVDDEDDEAENLEQLIQVNDNAEPIGHSIDNGVLQVVVSLNLSSEMWTKALMVILSQHWSLRTMTMDCLKPSLPRFQEPLFICRQLYGPQLPVGTSSFRPLSSCSAVYSLDDTLCHV